MITVLEMSFIQPMIIIFNIDDPNGFFIILALLGGWAQLTDLPVKTPLDIYLKPCVAEIGLNK